MRKAYGHRKGGKLKRRVRKADFILFPMHATTILLVRTTVDLIPQKNPRV